MLQLLPIEEASSLTVALWHSLTVALWHCGTHSLWHCGTVHSLTVWKWFIIFKRHLQEAFSRRFFSSSTLKEEFFKGWFYKFLPRIKRGLFSSAPASSSEWFSSWSWSKRSLCIHREREFFRGTASSNVREEPEEIFSSTVQGVLLQECRGSATGVFSTIAL